MSPRHSRIPTIPRLAALAASLAALGLLDACVATTPQWDSQFGASTRQLLEQQRHDPDATRRNGQDQPPADGRSVRATRDRTNGSGSTNGASHGLGALMTGGEDR